MFTIRVITLVVAVSELHFILPARTSRQITSLQAAVASLQNLNSRLTAKQASTDALSNNFTQTLAAQNATAQSQTSDMNNLNAQNQKLTNQYDAKGIDYSTCITYAFVEAQEFILKYAPKLIENCFLSYIASFSSIANSIGYQIAQFQAKISNVLQAVSGCFDLVCGYANILLIGALSLDIELFLGTTLAGLIFQLGFIITQLLVCFPTDFGVAMLTAFKETNACFVGVAPA